MEEKLKRLLSALLEIDEAGIDESTSAEMLERWDSLMQMNIIVAIEEEFEIEFSEEESILATSYESLLKLISSRSK
jgi:acyl carrier protein